MLSSNDGSFPVIMEFLKINMIVPDVCEIYKSIGYSIINMTDVNDINLQWRLIRNLTYLKEQNCDLNIEMLNFLRTLTFGGKLIKHGDQVTNERVMKILLPFCTNFFDDDIKYWNKIRHFCCDTVEVVDALNFLITNYGKEKNCKFLQNPNKSAFSLKHLARNKIRDVIWCNNNNNHHRNEAYYKLCENDLPSLLFKYINFLE